MYCVQFQQLSERLSSLVSLAALAAAEQERKKHKRKNSCEIRAEICHCYICCDCAEEEARDEGRKKEEKERQRVFWGAERKILSFLTFHNVPVINFIKMCKPYAVPWNVLTEHID